MCDDYQTSEEEIAFEYLVYLNLTKSSFSPKFFVTQPKFYWKMLKNGIKSDIFQNICTNLQDCKKSPIDKFRKAIHWISEANFQFSEIHK